MQKDAKIIVGIFVILVAANLLAWTAVFQLTGTGYLKVVFFDVGQGDAIFIETPQQNQILIDGGPTPVVVEKLGREMPFWDRTIDLIILTHPEKDHIAGLLDVLKRYKAENILWTGVIRETPEYEEWQKLLEREDARVFIAEAGQRIRCSECKKQKWAVDILFPFQNMRGQRISRSNNTSIVAKLSSGQIDMLLTGDTEAQVERELISEGLDVGAEILKVAHHGSKTSTTKEFVAAVSPEIAIISAGRDNPYGHPHPQTLETLERYWVRVFRTDEVGDVVILTDGMRYAIE